MNDLQTLFSIIFGIYFAATVSAVGRFHPFDTSAIVAGDRRALLRLLLSLVALDVVPFAYFLAVLGVLDSHPHKLTENWSDALAVLFAGLAGFGFYRLFVAAVTTRRGADSGKWWFYTDVNDQIGDDLRRHLSRRKPPEDALELPTRTVALGGAAWLALCFGMFAIGLFISG
jgi:hypothetical protein